MRLFTPPESERWLSNLGSEGAFPHGLRLGFPGATYQTLAVARAVEESLRPWSACLAFVAGFGVWPSSENWQLFYRWRQSYGDQRLLEEAPGHLCLDYERAEVVTLIQFAMLFGWDLRLSTAPFAEAFVSHDEFIEIAFESAAERNRWCAEFQAMELEVDLLDDAGMA